VAFTLVEVDIFAVSPNFDGDFDASSKPSGECLTFEVILPSLVPPPCKTSTMSF